MTNFQWFFLQKFKEDTNVHLAKVQERKRTNELLLNYIHMFQLNFWGQHSGDSDSFGVFNNIKCSVCPVT